MTKLEALEKQKRTWHNVAKRHERVMKSILYDLAIETHTLGNHEAMLKDVVERLRKALRNIV